MYSQGILVVKRINPDDFGLDELTSSGHSWNEVLRTYRGISGRAWPDEQELPIEIPESGLVATDRLAEVLPYFKAVSTRYNCHLLYCQVYDNIPAALVLPANLRFLGFDHGYLRNQYSCYSIVLHEVVYGLYSEVQKASPLLNEDLLVSSLESLKAIEEARNQLLAEGCDLEVLTDPDEECFQTIAVFEPEISPTP